MAGSDCVLDSHVYSYLMIVQVLLLLIGIMATLGVHRSAVLGNKRLALRLDQSVKEVAWIVYTGLMFAVVGFGAGHSIVFFVVVSLLSVLLATAVIVLEDRRRRWSLERKWQDMVRQLDSVDLEQQDGEKLMQQLFDAFDVDDSGSLSPCVLAVLKPCRTPMQCEQLWVAP